MMRGMGELRRAAAALAFVGALGASPVLARDGADPYVRWDGVRDRFRINVGGFLVGHRTFALLNSVGRPPIPGLDVEAQSQLPSDTKDFRVQGQLRLGGRHRLFGAWYAMKRSAVTDIEAEIEWDDEVFPIGATVATRWNTTVWKLEYQYSLVKRERLDIGLSAGVFRLEVESGIGLGASIGAVETDVKQAAPLPMFGGGVEWTFARGWTLRADAEYLALSIEGTLAGSWGEVRTGLEWQPHKNFGFGLGYNFADVDVELEFDGKSGTRKRFQYQYRFSGPLIYGLLAF